MDSSAWLHVAGGLRAEDLASFLFPGAAEGTRIGQVCESSGRPAELVVHAGTGLWCKEYALAGDLITPSVQNTQAPGAPFPWNVAGCLVDFLLESCAQIILAQADFLTAPGPLPFPGLPLGAQSVPRN